MTTNPVSRILCYNPLFSLKTMFKFNKFYTKWWIFYALWLVVANGLLEYKHMDDVSRLILFKMARSFETAYEIILD